MPGPVSSTPKGSDVSTVDADVAHHISEKKLIRPTDRVLLMVSGGADSTAMLHILSRMAKGGMGDGPSGFSLGVLHVNYGTRGNASDDDEQFVRALAERQQVPVHAVQAPVEERSNFQAWAREFRYDAARNLCSWQGYTKIAVAHNRDDRVETFIYRLLTYSGRHSLLVMPPRRGRIIRPLLPLEGAAIREYCSANRIEFRDDESNRDLRYRRNRIRYHVMPALGEVRPDFRRRIEETILLMEDEQAALDSVTDQAWEDAQTGSADEVEGETAVLSATSLALMDRAVARLVIRRWLGADSIPARVTRGLLDDIVDLCGSSRGTSRLSLPGNVAVERRYDTLHLVTDNQGDEQLPYPMELPLPGIVNFGGYRIEAERDPGDGSLDEDDPLSIIIDAGRLTGPLTVRSWKEGDRIRPLGMEGTRSLQDLFTDEKVPGPLRRHIPIVVCDDVIVWVCGLRMSEDFKLTPRSRQIIRLRAREEK